MPKLTFFKFMAEQLQPLLQDYQSEWHLTPVLYEDLSNLIHGATSHFIMSQVMEEAHTEAKLVSTNFCDKKKYIYNCASNFPLYSTNPRCLELPEKLKLYLNAVTKNKVLDHRNTSYLTTSEPMKETPIMPKLTFFKFMAEQLQPLLQDYQSEWHLTPVLYEDLSNLIHGATSHFIMSQVMEEAHTEAKLVSTNFCDKKKYISDFTEVRVGVTHWKSSRDLH